MVPRKELTSRETSVGLNLRRVAAGVLVLATGVFLLSQRDMPYDWVINTGLVILCIALLLLPASGRPVWWLIAVLAVAVLGVVNLPRYLVNRPDEHAWAKSVNGGEQIVMALGRYNQDSQAYPVHIQRLIDDGYLTAFPENDYGPGLRHGAYYELSRFERQALRIEMSSMQPVEKSGLTTTHPVHLDAPGNFAYLPRIVEDEFGGLTATGFTLLVFGHRQASSAWGRKAEESTIVTYYHNSETGVTRTWE